MRYFLSIVNIDEIDMYIIGIKEHLIYLKVYFTQLVHPYFVLHFD